MAFTYVHSNAKIGSECNICDHVFIENDVVIGDRVTIKCLVQVWDDVPLEDDEFVGHNVTISAARCFHRGVRHYIVGYYDWYTVYGWSRSGGYP